MLCLHTLAVFCFVGCLSEFIHEDNGVGWAYDYLATKSSYFSRPKIKAHGATVWRKENVTQGFEPFHVDFLYRHGTRYPSHDKLLAWKQRLQKLKQFDKSYKLKDTLELWDRYFPPNYSYALHRKGWFEMGVLADKLFEKTNQIFNHIFADQKLNKGTKFTILASPKARVLASANSFLTRLKCTSETSTEKDKQFCSRFQESKVLLNAQHDEGDVVIYGGFPVIINRKLLRTFDSCKKYTYTVERNSSAEKEFQDFFNTKIFNKMKSEISQNFNVALDGGDVVSLYQICAFVVSMHDKESLCNLFTKKHLEILEYASDLKHFYKTGHGHQINFRLACHLLSDIVAKLDEARDAPSKAQHSAVLRFGHAETLIPLLCLLGLFKDDVPLTSKNFELHKDRRMFRTGTFSPFAGNVGFVLYKATFQTSSPLKLAVVVSDHMIKIPAGDGCYLCDYDEVRDWLVSSMESFSCESVCEDTFIHNEF